MSDFVLQERLHLTWADSKEDVMRAYRFQKFIMAKSHRGNGTEFLSVDRLFFSSNIKLNTCLKDYFVDELDSMDFQQKAEMSRVQINSWVESVTKSMIKELLAPGTVTSQTDVVLANAAYFKVWTAFNLQASENHHFIFFFFRVNGRRNSMQQKQKRSYFIPLLVAPTMFL
jgi:serine protease inhibitor